MWRAQHRALSRPLGVEIRNRRTSPFGTKETTRPALPDGCFGRESGPTAHRAGWSANDPKGTLREAPKSEANLLVLVPRRCVRNAQLAHARPPPAGHSRM